MVRIISALVLAVTALAARADAPALVDNPPDRHIVVPGDTLWGISGKFLREPWRWPEIWQMNREEIRNPHRIYPGDIVLLDRSGASPRLRIAKPVGSIKVEPRVHSQAVAQAIPSIPPNAIEPFLSQPLIVEPAQEAHLPMVIATPEHRMLLGNGDEAFVTGIPDASVERWHVFRPGKPLKDPENGQVLAHEAFFLGHARLVQPGEPATVRITQAKQEMARGDRLQPAPPPEIMTYAPHRPTHTVSARVMSIYGGVSEGGGNSIVSLNQGQAAGLEVGHVLALFRNRVSTTVDDDGRRTTTPIPEERYALAFVFRVFERVAYALVIDAARPVIIGDAVRNP